MRVKDLIEELQKLDPELPICNGKLEELKVSRFDSENDGIHVIKIY